MSSSVLKKATTVLAIVLIAFFLYHRIFPQTKVTVASVANATEPSRSFSVPILMYHYIRPLPGPNDKEGIALTVTPENFSKQLDILQKKGYTTISFGQLADANTPLPKKPIILTFDDGYQDAYDAAFPALIAHHMTGTFYIISGFVGAKDYATWSELQKMSGSGMEMGAHTVHHLDLRKLTPQKQTSEIMRSIQTIQKKLKNTVISLAYPSGRYNADTLNIMQTSGLRFAVTTHKGIATDTLPPFELPRLRITNSSNFETLLRK